VKKATSTKVASAASSKTPAVPVLAELVPTTKASAEGAKSEVGQEAPVKVAPKIKASAVESEAGQEAPVKKSAKIAVQPAKAETPVLQDPVSRKLLMSGGPGEGAEGRMPGKRLRGESKRKRRESADGQFEEPVSQTERADPSVSLSESTSVRESSRAAAPAPAPAADALSANVEVKVTPVRETEKEKEKEKESLEEVGGVDKDAEVVVVAAKKENGPTEEEGAFGSSMFSVSIGEFKVPVMSLALGCFLFVGSIFVYCALFGKSKSAAAAKKGKGQTTGSSYSKVASTDGVAEDDNWDDDWEAEAGGGAKVAVGVGGVLSVAKSAVAVSQQQQGENLGVASPSRGAPATPSKESSKKTPKGSSRSGSGSSNESLNSDDLFAGLGLSAKPKFTSP